MPTKRAAGTTSKRPTPIDDDDDDGGEEEAPRRMAPRPQGARAEDEGDYLPGAADKLRGGFAGAKKEMAAASAYANRFVAEAKNQVIKFLEPEPFINYRRHWITTTTQQGMTKRTYACYRSIGQDCPLCKAGSKSQFVSCYNIALLSSAPDGEVVIELKAWECGVRVATSLEDLANDPKIGPLTRNYFRVSKSGEGVSTSYNVSSLKARDLEEDEGIAPPSVEELQALGLYDKDIVKFSTQKVMEELAEQIADEY